MPKLEVILSPESLRSRLCHESEGSGVENELWDAKTLYFLREESWPRKPEECGTIRIWPSNDATDMLIGLWSEETVQFTLENSKTSKETREVYSTLQVNNTFFLIQFDHNMMHHLKDCEVTGLLIDARDKFES